MSKNLVIFNLCLEYVSSFYMLIQYKDLKSFKKIDYFVSFLFFGEPTQAKQTTRIPFFLFHFIMYVIQHSLVCRHLVPLCRRMLGSNPRL
jgi:hypothetical protein